jgi:type IV secretory pathway VirB6-like protein
MSYALQCLLVFVAMAIADICWAYYFIKIDERKSVAAGMWGSAIYICGAVSVVSYTQDRTLIIPAVLGAFVGTYLTIEYKKRKENKK